MLTKRVADGRKTQDENDKRYAAYIQRVIDFTKKAKEQNDPNWQAAAKVKLADLNDNRDPNRNPPRANQSAKDERRIARYNIAFEVLSRAFPEVTLRPKPKHGKGNKKGKASPKKPRNRAAARKSLQAQFG